MKLKNTFLLACICIVTGFSNISRASNIDYENACNSYGFNEEQCEEWQVKNKAFEQSRNRGTELVYKIRLRDAATGNIRQGGIFSPGDKDREEWVVVTLIDNQEVKIRHATNIENKFWGTRQWYDHPAIAIRVCDVTLFDSNECLTTEGDTTLLPEGKTIHDVQFDFKYSEGGAIYTRSIQIGSDAKPAD